MKMTQNIRDLRIDEQVVTAYEKAYLDSQVYVCNCIDKYDCSTCNDTYDLDHNIPQPVAIAKLKCGYSVTLYQDDLERGFDIDLDMKGFTISAI